MINKLSLVYTFYYNTLRKLYNKMSVIADKSKG